MIRRMTDASADRPRFRRPALKSTLAAAAWLTEAARTDGVRLQPRKLQYLLYMAQGLYAAANDGRALVPSRFVAGSLGPADPNLYGALEHAEDLAAPKEIDRRAEACLGLIHRKFASLPMEQLEGFVDGDGIYADVREAAPDAEIPLELMGPAYRKAFMGDARETASWPAEPAPPPPAPPQPDDLPEGVPRMVTGGKPVKRWAPKRRVY
jgi:hypothetical protein